MTDSTSYTLGLGIMSGTSCDGLDLALCRFSDDNQFEILAFKSVPYSQEFRASLLGVGGLTASELLLMENKFTCLVADAVNEFVDEAGMRPEFIGAHGHTVFHQPDRNFTYQMLNGGMLAALTMVDVVCDFRRQDVALQGQGAPLVPFGDMYLFPQYDACLNIGGFANVSFIKQLPILAFDICPANILLNALAQREGKPYDEDGAMARSGQVDEELLQILSAKDYYNSSAPKSLGREWFENELFPHFAIGNKRSIDHLATATSHIAEMIAKEVNKLSTASKVLLSGGGAYNSYLVELIATKSTSEIVIPDALVIESKEALIFAFLAKKRLEGKHNVIADVTGASRDACAGALYLAY